MQYSHIEIRAAAEWGTVTTNDDDKKEGGSGKAATTLFEYIFSVIFFAIVIIKWPLLFAYGNHFVNYFLGETSILVPTQDEIDRQINKHL